MQKRGVLVFLFLFLFSFSAVLFFLFSNNPNIPGGVFINRLFSPVREGIIRFTNRGESSVESENATLRKALRDQKKDTSDLKALRDQFDTATIRTTSLLPANIVGMRGYIPGTSLPEGFILDKGSLDGVKNGQVVVYKDNVVGKIRRVTDTTSLLELAYNTSSTINAKTLKTNAIGIIKGQGQGMMQLSGVVLSEKLEKGDQVLTKGDKELSGSGYPPDLVIGKIISVDKKASNLFQSAQVESFLPITKLTMVFIMTVK